MDVGAWLLKYSSTLCNPYPVCVFYWQKEKAERSSFEISSMAVVFGHLEGFSYSSEYQYEDIIFLLAIHFPWKTRWKILLT